MDAVVAKQEAIYLIEGGAGTGKSLVLMNALIKMISSTGSFQSKRILFCGATNISVDHIAHRFLKRKNTERFGTYFPVSQSILHKICGFLALFLLLPHQFLFLVCSTRLSTVRFGNLETIHQSLSVVTVRAHNLSSEELQCLNDARLVLTTTNLAANLLK